MKRFWKMVAGVVLVWLIASATWSSLSGYVAKSAIVHVGQRE